MKYFILLAALLVLPTIVQAELRDVPKGYEQSLPSADYGGVDVATVTYSSANVLLFGRPGGSIAWIHFSSAGPSTDFAIIRASNPFNAVSSAPTKAYLTPGAVSGGPGQNPLSADWTTNNEVFRLFVSSSLQNNWTGAASFSPLTGYTYVFPKPLRLPNGGLFKLSSVSYGPVTIGYTQHGIGDQ